MGEYFYSLINDFGSQLNSDQFNDEIKNETWGVNFLGLRINDDNVIIVFDGSLTTEEQNTLNTLVNNHNAVMELEFSKDVTLIPSIDKFRLNLYTLCLSYYFCGSCGIKSIKIYSYMDPNTTSYDIKIVDITNNHVIASNNFNNIVPILNDIGTISNIPNGKAVFDVLIKKNGGSQGDIVYVKNVFIYI